MRQRLHWQPREPPLIGVDDSFVLDRWRPADGPALRRFDLDPDTARFFGYSVGQAAAMPDSHYDGDTRARGNLMAWREGRQLNLAIRRIPDGEAVGWVELQRAGEQAEVSYNVTAELRGQGPAPRARRRPIWLAAQARSALSRQRGLLTACGAGVTAAGATLRRRDLQRRITGHGFTRLAG